MTTDEVGIVPEKVALLYMHRTQLEYRQSFQDQHQRRQVCRQWKEKVAQITKIQQYQWRHVHFLLDGSWTHTH